MSASKDTDYFSPVQSTPETLRRSLFDDFLDTPDDAVLQHDFDAVRMMGRLCKDSLNDAFSQLSAALVLLFDDSDTHARLDIRSCLAIHGTDCILSGDDNHRDPETQRFGAKYPCLQ